MIFADKLIQLRKKAGWSQEELAEQMGVTRQAVSKWESAQSIPDLEKVLRLSELFGVSTDYLLKDEIEDEPQTAETPDTAPSARRVTMEEANAFLAAREETAKPMALGTLLCILSPVCLLVLGALCETPGSGISEGAAGGVGMIVLLALVAVAVMLFLKCGSKTSAFEYLDKEEIETEYGVSGMARDRMNRMRERYTRSNAIGVCLCILSLVPLFAGSIFNQQNVLLIVCLLAMGFVMVGIGVTLMVYVGVIWGGYQRLLQEGDYTLAKKRARGVTSAVSVAYWLIATAVFLAYSLTTNRWDISWVVWAVAGVLYPAALALTGTVSRRGKE